jgi:predicted transcriptional regulator
MPPDSTPKESSMGASAKESLDVAVSPELKARLDSYAQLTGEPEAHIAAEAIAQYLDWRVPQAQDLQEAIAAADRGEFASDEEVEAVFRNHGA